MDGDSAPLTWVSVGTRSRRERLVMGLRATLVSGITLLLLFQVVNLGVQVVNIAGGSITTAVSVVAIVALASGSALIVVTALRSALDVDLNGRRVRIGRKTVAFAQVDSVEYGLQGSLRHPLVFLRLGAAGGAKADVFLYDRGRVLLDRAASDLLISVIRESAIRMPVSRYDPTGRFARYNFPGHLGKDTAIDVVENPERPLPGFTAGNLSAR